MIAKQYGTSVAVIAKINDLKGGKVTAGETLKIPEISGELPDKVLLAAARVDRPETDLGGRRQRQIVYRVRAGETLSTIARRHGMPVSTLARLNNMGAADTLVKGQRLVIKASARRFRDEGRGVGTPHALYGAQRRHRVQHFTPISGVGHAAEELERTERASSNQSRTTTRNVCRFEPATGVEKLMGFLSGKRALDRGPRHGSLHCLGHRAGHASRGRGARLCAYRAHDRPGGAAGQAIGIRYHLCHGRRRRCGHRQGLCVS